MPKTFHYIKSLVFLSLILFTGKTHSETWYPLVSVNWDDPANTLTLLADYQINGSLTITSGKLIIDENSNSGAIDIQCSDSNYNVTGGEVILNYGGNSTVYSKAIFYDVDILNGTDVTLTNALVVSNYLTINNTEKCLGR